jgi:iron(III) transport system substrate-binding protein
MSRLNRSCPRRLRRRRAPLAALAALGALTLVAGCGGGGSPNSIVLYNGQHPELTQALVSAFTKATGITVQTRTDDGVILADQLMQEGSASPADVYVSENSPEMMTLEQHGLLGRLPAATLAQIPAAYRSPAGQWVGIALRISTLVYNPSLLRRAELPASILDLARPRWKGKLAIAPTDSDFPPIVGAVIASRGEQAASAWLAGLKRNAQTYQDEEAVVAAVNRGDEAAGIVNQYYWYRLRLEDGAQAMRSALYYFPRTDVGSITNISGATVLASSHNRAAAQRFVRFLIGAEAQRILARSDDFEYPARPGIPANPALPPLAAVPHATLPVIALGSDQRATQLIEASGLV